MRKLACLWLVAAACGPGAAEVIEKRKAGALAKREAYRALVDKVIASPVLEPPKLPEKLVWDEDTLFIHPEWLAGENARAAIISDIGSFHETLGWCYGNSPMSYVTGKFATEAFDRFEAIEMFVALETLSYQEGLARDDSFTPGSFRGRIHFIDVSRGVSLGSVDVEAISTTKTLSATEGQEQRAVKNNTASHAQTAIEKALAPYLAPGQKAFP